jgi:hypothetical protein
VPKIENIGGLKAGEGLAEITNIKELDDLIKQIQLLMGEFKKLNELKGMIDVYLKMKNLVDILKEAQSHLKHQTDLGRSMSE